MTFNQPVVDRDVLRMAVGDRESWKSMRMVLDEVDENGAATTTATITTLGHGRPPLRGGAQDTSSKTSKCLPILTHYRQPDLQEGNLIEYLKKVKPGWWEA